MAIGNQLNLYYHSVKVSERKQFVLDVIAWVKDHRSDVWPKHEPFICYDCRRGDHAHCSLLTSDDTVHLYMAWCDCDHGGVKP